MKQIITEYGYFLLDGIALVLLVFLLFHGMAANNGSNLFSVIGPNLKIETVNYNTYTDFKRTYLLESEKKPPFIFYQGGNLTIGDICLTNYIKATDHAGHTLPVKILSILNMHGTELIGSFRQDSSEITLSQPGIYTIAVSAVDDGNRLTKCTIKIPVNR